MKIKLIDFGLKKDHYPFRPHENDAGADVYMPYDYTLKPGEIEMCIRDRWNAFQDEKKLDDVKLEKESGRALQHVVTKTGDCYRYEADVTFTEGTRGFSVGVRAQEADDEFYSFTFECPKDRVLSLIHI